MTFEELCEAFDKDIANSFMRPSDFIRAIDAYLHWKTDNCPELIKQAVYHLQCEGYEDEARAVLDLQLKQ